MLIVPISVGHICRNQTIYSLVELGYLEKKSSSISSILIWQPTIMFILELTTLLCTE